jgi:hypothetical protein
MGSLKVLDVLYKAETLLLDTLNIRWTKAELLGWLNDGQREIALLLPQASITNEVVTLLAGSTKQTIPPTGVFLIALSRNMGTTGATPGTPIRLVVREVLDSQTPNWHSEPNLLGYITHYCYDSFDPTSFYVYPKAPVAACAIEIVYSSIPKDCSLEDTLVIADIYANALIDYILYRAYTKDGTLTGSAPLAATHYGAFSAALGTKTTVDKGQNPNLAVKCSAQAGKA